MSPMQWKYLQDRVARLLRTLAIAKRKGRADIEAKLRSEMKTLIHWIGVAAAMEPNETMGLGTSPAGIGCSDCTAAAMAGLASQLRGAL